MNRSKIVIGLLGFTILGLVLLLVRESEGRVRAETKLNDLKFKMESTTNENDTLVMDLKNTIHDLQVQIVDMKDKHDIQMAEKAGQIQDLNTQMEGAANKHKAAVQDKNNEIADVESKSKEQSDQLNKIIKDKSAKISELGSELEKASARYSTLLTEKESLEAKTISMDADVASLRQELKKAQREKERLSAAILALTQKPETVHD